MHMRSHGIATAEADEQRTERIFKLKDEQSELDDDVVDEDRQSLPEKVFSSPIMLRATMARRLLSNTGRFLLNPSRISCFAWPCG